MEENDVNQLKEQMKLFLERVYRQGLHEIITTSPERGMSGTFDGTMLFSFKTAGRIMLTFARDEDSVSFVFDESDPLGLRFGPQSLFSELNTAIGMIDDVTSAWPGDPWSRRAVYEADATVSIG